MILKCVTKPGEHDTSCWNINQQVNLQNHENTIGIPCLKLMYFHHQKYVID